MNKLNKCLLGFVVLGLLGGSNLALAAQADNDTSVRVHHHSTKNSLKNKSDNSSEKVNAKGNEVGNDKRDSGNKSARDTDNTSKSARDTDNSNKSGNTKDSGNTVINEKVVNQHNTVIKDDGNKDVPVPVN